MMRTRPYTKVLTVITLTLLMTSGIAATSLQMQGETPKGKMSKDQHGMMDKSAMKQDPHHQLAMAYRDNLVNFAKALREEAAVAKTVNTEFARAAVAEMKRSFDQMQEHHKDHMKAMDEKMKAQMADNMKHMDAHHLAIQEHLAALDKEAQTSAPDSKSMTKYVAAILKHCDGMAKMHSGTMDHKTAAPKEHKMN